MIAMLDMHPSNASETRHHASPFPAGRCFAAETVGCRLQQTLRRGRVAAIFDKACVVEMADGGVVAVLASDVGNVAHGMRIVDYGELRRNLRTGIATVLDGTALIFNDGEAAVTFARARIWRSRFRLGMAKPNFCAVNADQRLRYLLSQHGASSGSEFLAATLSRGSRTTELAAWLAAALPHLALATQKREPDAALASLRRLIGLGPGLTPAGDDFIVGWLAGLALTAQSHEDLVFVRAMAAGIGSMSEATTAVSRQHIADACAFEFSERLSDLCIALCERASLPILLESRLALQFAVGATSGADAAAGLAFALRVCASQSPTYS